ncbi:DivIVA domain-containing protein [Actinomadura harenae]|nr:DivIVA domain-containing protein [Actinomadura harenae]
MPVEGGDMLTPSEVARKVFTTVRLREGYDLFEVNDFLTEVETTLTALHRELDTLRSRPPESPETAAGVMRLAQETSDRLLEAAQREAADIVERARERAATLEDEARASAAELLDDARARHGEALHSAEEVVRFEADLRAGLDDQVSGIREILRGLERQRRSLPGPHGRPRQLPLLVPPPSDATGAPAPADPAAKPSPRSPAPTPDAIPIPARGTASVPDAARGAAAAQEAAQTSARGAAAVPDGAPAPARGASSAGVSGPESAQAQARGAASGPTPVPGPASGLGSGPGSGLTRGIAPVPQASPAKDTGADVEAERTPA